MRAMMVDQREYTSGRLTPPFDAENCTVAALVAAVRDIERKAYIEDAARRGTGSWYDLSARPACMWFLVALVAAVALAACGTDPGVWVDDAGAGVVLVAAPSVPMAYVVITPEDEPVEVYGRHGLAQCIPGRTEAGHACVGPDGWTEPVGCGMVGEWRAGCTQLQGAPHGCGHEVVTLGRRMCD